METLEEFKGQQLSRIKA